MFKLCSPDSRSRACQLFWPSMMKSNLLPDQDQNLLPESVLGSRLFGRDTSTACSASEVQSPPTPHRLLFLTKVQKYTKSKIWNKKNACSASVVQSPPTPPLVQTFYRTKVRKQNKIIKKTAKNCMFSPGSSVSSHTTSCSNTPNLSWKKKKQKNLTNAKKSECSALVVRYPPTPPPVVSFC